VAFAIAALAMWWLGRNVAIAQFSFSGQTPLGIGLTVLGLVIVAISLRSFAVARTTPNPMHPQAATSLVASGIYSLSRNPMYVGDAVMLAGVVVWTGNVFNLVPLAAFVAYMDRFQIVAEEKALVQVFGKSYAAYCRRVRRWL